MCATRVGIYLVLLVLLAVGQTQAALSETPDPGASQIPFDVVIAEMQSPIQSLIPPSRSLTNDQFPLAGLLASAKEKANYLNYIERLEKRGRLKILTRAKVVAQSGQLTNFLFKDTRAPLPPVGFVGSIGIQFEDYSVGVGVLPVLLADGTVRLDVETELTSTNRTEADHRAIRAVQLRSGQTLLLAGPEDRYAEYPFHSRPLLEIASPNDRYVFLVTPHIPQPAETATKAAFLESVLDQFRCPGWPIQELQAEVETRWDELRLGYQIEHDGARLSAARRRSCSSKQDQR